MTRVIAVASGKGGAGKTSVAVNLAFALARLGRRVCLLDADLGLSNVDIVLGIAPARTLEHVLFDDLPMEQAVTPVGPGVDVIAGSSGVSRMAELSRAHRARLASEFAKLSTYHYLLVDNSPGISSQVVSLCLACGELLMVVNPEPSSMTDAYALIKVLKENGLCRSPGLLLNRVASEAQGADIHARMKAACAKHLRLGCRYLGCVPRDEAVTASAARQRPLLEWAPASPAARAFLGLAALLEGDAPALTGALGQPEDFFERSVVRMLETPARTPGSPAYPSPPAQAAFPEATTHLDAALRVLNDLEDLKTRPEARRLVHQLRASLAAVRRIMDPAAQNPMTAASAPSPASPAVSVAERPMADPVPGIVEQAGKRGEGQTSGLFSIQGSKRQSIRNTTLSSASSQPSALRVSVASADPAMGDILEESLVSAGMVVTRIAVGPSLGPGQVHGQARDGAPHMPPPMPSQAAPQVVVVQLDGPLGPEGHSGLPGLAETHPLTPLVLVDGFGRWAQVGMNRTVLANQAPGRLTGRPTAGPLTGGMSALNMGPPGGRTAAGVASPEANPEASPGAGPGPGRRTEVVPAPFRVEALIEAVRRCVGSLGNVPDNPSTGRSSGAAAGSPGH